jgi:hypothetical protein
MEWTATAGFGKQGAAADSGKAMVGSLKSEMGWVRAFSVICGNVCEIGDSRLAGRNGTWRVIWGYGADGKCIRMA